MKLPIFIFLNSLLLPIITFAAPQTYGELVTKLLNVLWILVSVFIAYAIFRVLWRVTNNLVIKGPDSMKSFGDVVWILLYAALALAVLGSFWALIRVFASFLK